MAARFPRGLGFGAIAFVAACAHDFDAPFGTPPSPGVGGDGTAAGAGGDVGPGSGGRGAGGAPIGDVERCGDGVDGDGDGDRDCLDDDCAGDPACAWICAPGDAPEPIGTTWNAYEPLVVGPTRIAWVSDVTYDERSQPVYEVSVYDGTESAAVFAEPALANGSLGLVEDGVVYGVVLPDEDPYDANYYSTIVVKHRTFDGGSPRILLNAAPGWYLGELLVGHGRIVWNEFRSGGTYESRYYAGRLADLAPVQIDAAALGSLSYASLGADDVLYTGYPNSAEGTFIVVTTPLDGGSATTHTIAALLDDFRVDGARTVGSGRVGALKNLYAVRSDATVVAIAFGDAIGNYRILGDRVLYVDTPSGGARGIHAASIDAPDPSGAVRLHDVDVAAFDVDPSRNCLYWVDAATFTVYRAPIDP